METINKKDIFLTEFLPFIVCFVIGAVCYIFTLIYPDVLPHGSMCFAYVATSIVPLLLYVFFRFRLPSFLKVIFYVFSFMALIMANVFNLYELWDDYDTFLHFLSGPICCLLFFFILTISGGKIKDTIAGFFALLFEMGCGAFWEVIEYFLDTFNNNNSQHYLESGVVDTMHDILAETIGGCVFIVLFYLDCLLDKRRAVSWMYNQLSVYSKYDFRLLKEEEK